jgi:hypothetical protein
MKNINTNTTSSGTLTDNTYGYRTGTSTSNYNLWSNPEFVDVIENNDSIEMIYKETSMICYTSFPAPPPEVRVFKYVFSCVDGKWNKSNRIYGKVVPASDESYEFE